MEAQLFRDVSLFGEVVAPYVAADPFSTNVISVQADRILTGTRVQGEGDCFIAVSDGDDLVGIAMWTPPHHAFLSRMAESAAFAVADAMLDAELEIPGVNGEISAVAAFSERWSSRTGGSAVVQTAMRLYRLDRLRRPVGVAGRPRVADHSDLDLVIAWERDFHEEATPEQPLPDRTAELSGRIGAGEISLWVVDEEPVAMAARSAAPVGVARIGTVFTPRLRRRLGYGSAVTAAATQRALDAGARHVALYTDLGNPTSNAIYQSLGYVVHHDAEERRLER